MTFAVGWVGWEVYSLSCVLLDLALLKAHVRGVYKFSPGHHILSTEWVAHG